MPPDFIRLHSGKRLHILAPQPEEIDIKDIAWGLSNLCRYTGHTRHFYSVAQHSCHVADNLHKSLKLRGLLHDAQEAYLGDITSPVKQYLPDYRALEERIEQAIAARFGLTLPFPPAIKHADMVLLATEMRDLMKGADWQHLDVYPIPGPITPWTPAKARREFLKRFNWLTSSGPRLNTFDIASHSH